MVSFEARSISAFQINVCQVFLGTLRGAMTSVGQFLDTMHDGQALTNECSHLSFVRNAFEGIPTLIRIHTSPEDVRYAIDTSDILQVS
jgi:hypothetical protein